METNILIFIKKSIYIYIKIIYNIEVVEHASLAQLVRVPDS